MPDRFIKRCETRLPALFLALSALRVFAAPAAAVIPTPAFDADLQAKGAFVAPRARAGDTVEYRLRVEWRDVPAALMILPPRDELKTPGFTIIGQSALYRKTASAGSIRNVSEFSYWLVAGEEGLGRVEPFSLRYSDGLSGRVESVPVGGSSLDIGPARIPLLKRFFVQAGLALLAVIVLVLGIVTSIKKRRRGSSGTEKNPAEDEFTRAVMVLKNRCEAADSRQWLRDAETLSVAFLCRDLGVSKLRDVRFEAALDHYLARKPARDSEETESWVKLRDLFHEARYAGGRKEPHELREACRHLKACLSPATRPIPPPESAPQRPFGKMENVT